MTKTVVSSTRAIPSRATPSAAGANAATAAAATPPTSGSKKTPLLVVKRSGAEEVFARAKLLNGLLRACEKRHISLERIERVADEIEGELRRESVQQVTSAEIGERALRHLRDLDRVAYIRFASVYRQFDDIEEFQHELARLEPPGDADAGREPLPGPATRRTTVRRRRRAPVDQPALTGSNGGRGHDS